MTIPSPSCCIFATAARPCQTRSIPTWTEFYADLGAAYRKAVQRLRRCRLPLSAARRGQPRLSVRSEAARAGARARRRSGRAAADLCRLINTAISDIPADMTICMHLCRGNFRSTFVASGGYEPVAEVLFNQIDVHGYFMEYDTDRAGGFEPLRFVPKGKTVVLGLVTSKSGRLENKDELKRRIERGREIRAARAALPVAAMRLRLDRGRQYPGRGRAMGEARDDRGNRRRGVGKADRRSRERESERHEENHERKNNTAISRRSCRLAAAPRRAERSPRQIRQRRHRSRRARRRSKTAKSSASSRSRRRWACNPSPTANSAAPGGISISCGASTAPRST